MELNKYQELSSRTVKKDNTFDELVCEMCLGLAGETGETIDVVKKHLFHKHGLDVEDLAKELGDILWYLSQLSLLFGISLEYVATKNIDKLTKRYPNGFDSNSSINRSE